MNTSLLGSNIQVSLCCVSPGVVSTEFQVVERDEEVSLWCWYLKSMCDMLPGGKGSAVMKRRSKH